METPETPYESNETEQPLEDETTPDNEVDQTLDEIGGDVQEAVEATVETRAHLPVAVRERAEELFALILDSMQRSDEAGGNWMKTSEDQQNIVELASLICEYNTQSSEFFNRTKNRLSYQAARKFLSANPSLSEVEKKVIEILQNSLTIKEDRGNRDHISATDKIKFHALLRLVRKQHIGPEEARKICKKYSIGNNTAFNTWNKEYGTDDNGELKLTEEMVPEVYAQAKKELEEASKPKPVEPVAEEDQEETQADEPQQQKNVTEVATVPVATEAQPVGNGVLAQVVAQNQEALDALRTADQHQAAAIQSLISMNNLIIQELLGQQQPAPVVGNAIPTHALKIGHNEIHLSPNVRGTIKVVETETTLQLQDL